MGMVSGTGYDMSAAFWEQHLILWKIFAQRIPSAKEKTHKTKRGFQQ